ncbi:MAG: tRNA pseudouridine(55) synthase TruB [Candidatus Magasanikbacteria bacterium]|nr:tRNA pseudouridine(55) synthase TruB [Candidatus Magasanikbacteria bacterium]
MKQGYILIDKPAGWTSHDIVAYIRKLLKRSDPSLPKRFRVGHAGTLDPFATGLLIVGIGREATRQIDIFKDLDKTYIATIELGARSDTYDSEGIIIMTPDSHNQTPNFEEVKTILNNFIGKQIQIPPMYSAKKVGGKKLYELAREGKEIERKAHKIKIYTIKILEYMFPKLKIEIQCSTGTYIRSLAHDIGQKLGIGAYCTELCRTKIGKYSLDLAKKPKDIDLDTIETQIFDLSTEKFCVYVQ